MSVGKDIRTIRKALGLTQGGLAKCAHCTRETVSNIERETVKPSKRFLSRLGTFLCSMGKIKKVEELAKEDKISRETAQLLKEHSIYLDSEGWDNIFDEFIPKRKERETGGEIDPAEIWKEIEQEKKIEREDIGHYIKGARQNLGWSRRELAKWVKLNSMEKFTEKKLGRIERGDFKRDLAKEIKTIAIVLLSALHLPSNFGKLSGDNQRNEFIKAQKEGHNDLIEIESYFKRHSPERRMSAYDLMLEVSTRILWSTYERKGEM